MDYISTILSILLSAITTITALLTSILTIHINNKHQNKMKKIDILYEKRYNEYKKFNNQYKEFLINNTYDKDILIQIISDCILIASDDTTMTLKTFLRKIYGIASPSVPNDKFLFDTCIKKMKKDLDIFI